MEMELKTRKFAASEIYRAIKSDGIIYGDAKLVNSETKKSSYCIIRMRIHKLHPWWYIYEEIIKDVGLEYDIKTVSNIEYFVFCYDKKDLVNLNKLKSKYHKLKMIKQKLS